MRRLRGASLRGNGLARDVQIAAQHFGHNLRRCHAFEEHRAGIVVAHRRCGETCDLLAKIASRLRQVSLGEHFGWIARV
jgi:hypothetical protein